MMAKRKKSLIQLEAGTCGKDVWIGAPTQCYEEAEKPLSGNRLHILRFTTEQADAVIEMLQTEVARQRLNSKPQPPITKMGKRLLGP